MSTKLETGVGNVKCDILILNREGDGV